MKVWMGTYVRTKKIDGVAKWEKDEDHGKDIFTAEQFVVAHYCPVRVEDEINIVVPENERFDLETLAAGILEDFEF